MRRPLILFLLLVSVYCWVTDCVNFLFFAADMPGSNSRVLINIIAVLSSISFIVLFKKAWFKNKSFPELIGLVNNGSKREWLLLVLVSSPVILLGLFRAIYPDQNYDTLHFELYLQDYNLKDNSINFAAGSIRSYYFPLPERMFSLFRHIVGFRLGTILNLILLIAIFFSVYDFIKKVYAVYWPQLSFPAVQVAILSLFTIFADNTLFNIGSYKPDLIGIPFILELAHIIFFPSKNANKKTQQLYFFLIASLTIAFKLTYLPYVAVFCFIYWFRNIKIWSKKELFFLPMLLLVFPFIYMLYNLLQTGNPIFPFYNKLFHSAQYPIRNFKDERWGPRVFYETFIYPVVIFLDKSRCNEWQLFSYRLMAGYFLALVNMAVYFINFKKHKNNPFFRFMVNLAVIAFLFDILCIISTGYYRYGIIVEVFYGLIISLWYLYFSRQIISFFLLIIMILQWYSTFDSIYRKQINLSWHDYKELAQSKKLLKDNTRLMFHDYGSIADPDSILHKINGFVNVDPFPQDGLARLLNKNVPIYNLELSSRTPALTTGFEKNIVRPKTLKERCVTVASIEALNESIMESLNKRGFFVSDMYEVYPDFMKFGEPVFLLQLRYLDTSRYFIKTMQQYIRDENPPETRNDFTYKTGHKLKVFLREAPYTFYWNFLPAEYDISVNDKKYVIKNKSFNNKIISVECNGLTIHKPNAVPYLLLIQEVWQKQEFDAN